MINETIYRLGEHRIIEYENDLLRWEKLFNFCVQRIGKCFVLNDILIIGKWSHEEPGYLQLEFSEQLQKLPVWGKTRYYCFASELLNISNGQSLSKDFLERYLTLTSSTGSKSLMNICPGMFRLGRYQIAVTDQGEVLWQTHEGLHRVVGGRCVIESDVLFIGPQEYDEENQSKREFLHKLNQLPKWDKSVAWSRNLVLRSCQNQKSEDAGSTIHHQDTMDEHPFDEEPPTGEKLTASYLNHCKESPERLLLSVFNWSKSTCRRIHGGKGWLKYLVPLVVVGLLLGLVVILFSVEKKSHDHRLFEEHHHKHDDKKR
jgi:hypothetical protein